MSTLRVLSLAAALSLATAAVSAQNPPDPYNSRTPESSSSSSASQDTMGSRRDSGDTASSSSTAQSSRDTPESWKDNEYRSSRVAMAGQTDKHRVSKIIGRNVQTSTGDTIGEVKDVIIDSNGKVTHALISYGGAAGVGNKLAAVPWPTVTSMAQGDKIVIERNRLESAPSFDERNAPNFATSGWSREADRYWGSGGTRSSSTPPSKDRG